MAQCITCGSELHPDRAKKYSYCMAPDCQRKNVKGLDLVAIGVLASLAERADGRCRMIVVTGATARPFADWATAHADGFR